MATSDFSESEFVTEGGTVTLSCNKVTEGQRKCDGTTWTFRSAKDPRNTVEVIKLGKISSRVTEMSNRLKVTENCGLQIQNVLPQDAGRFYCKQYNQSGRLLSTDPAVYLSVVSLTKGEDEEKKNVHLRCNTFSSHPDVKVKWRINDKDVNNQQINTDFGKNINVTVLYSEFYSDTNLFKCEVSDGEKKKEFSFSSNRPVETKTITTRKKKKGGKSTTKPVETTTKTITTQKKKEGGKSTTKPVATATKTITTQKKKEEVALSVTSPGWLWAAVVVVVVVVAALVLTAVVLVTWRRLRVKPANTRRHPPAQPEEEVSYTAISFNMNQQRTEVQEREEEVTYSTVRSNAAEDPAQLYATVNKNTNNQRTANR